MNTAIKIETGIPVPAPRFQDAVYPFKKMQVGESCLVPPKEDETGRALRERVSAALAHYHRDGSMKFCSRKVDGGIRVWRIG